jgi:hypothetical protein
MIDQLVERCRHGPPGARVASVGRDAAADDGAGDFQQRPTAWP